MRPDKAEQGETAEDEVLAALERVKDFLWENALHLLVAVGVIFLGVLGYQYYTLSREAETLQDWRALGGIPGNFQLLFTPSPGSEQMRKEAVAACRRILQTGSETSAHPWVMLRLASLLAGGEQWEEAAETYRQLLEEYPDGQAAKTALPGYAAVMEEMGDYERAAALYEELAAGDRKLHLFDAARCRELNGELEAAQALYRNFLQTPPADQLGDLARSRLTALARGEVLQPPPRPPEAKQPTIEAPEAPAETPLELLRPVPAETPLME